MDDAMREFIKMNYKTMGPTAIAKKLGITKSQVVNEKNRKGYDDYGDYKPYTDEQKEFIKNHPDKTHRWIAENIPGPKRTVEAIRNFRKKQNKKASKKKGDNDVTKT